MSNVRPAKLRLEDFDAVAFDLEGTLANTIPTHHFSRAHAFAEHGYGHITKQEHAKGGTYGSSHEAIAGGVLHAAGAIDATVAFADHALVKAIVKTHKATFATHAGKGFEAMPDAIEFVHWIAPYFKNHMAIVTSASEDFIAPFLQKHSIMSYFYSQLIIGEETTQREGLAGKPAPDPYLLAMRRLNTKKLLVFEDSVSGVASAKQAGATVIALGFDGPNMDLFINASLPFPPDIIVPSYAEAKKVFGI